MSFLTFQISMFLSASAPWPEPCCSAGMMVVLRGCEVEGRCEIGVGRKVDVLLVGQELQLQPRSLSKSHQRQACTRLTTATA
jgi:hypothetical protein